MEPAQFFTNSRFVSIKRHGSLIFLFGRISRTRLRGGGSAPETGLCGVPLRSILCAWRRKEREDPLGLTRPSNPLRGPWRGILPPVILPQSRRSQKSQKSRGRKATDANWRICAKKNGPGLLRGRHTKEAQSVPPDELPHKNISLIKPTMDGGFCQGIPGLEKYLRILTPPSNQTKGLKSNKLKKFFFLTSYPSSTSSTSW
jgi:hypothetical protein